MNKETCMIDSWQRLTLAAYDEIRELVENEPDITARTPAVIAILADTDVETIEDLPAHIFADMKARAGFLLAEPKVTPKYRKEYHLGRFVLVPVVDVKKLTAAQYIDFQTILDRKADDLAALLAVLLVPKGKKYGRGYDIDEVKETIRERMPVQYAFELRAFFLLLSETLISYFRRYYVGIMTKGLPPEVLKTTTEALTENLRRAETALKVLRNAGAGLQSWTK